jgi:hypothetical protein
LTPFERHGIDLDRKACGLRGLDAVFHLGEIAPAGDGLELGVIQRIAETLIAMSREFTHISS